MLARAGAQAGDGAGALFARLDAMGERRAGSAELLERIAVHIRAGEWTIEVTALMEQAVVVAEALAIPIEEAATPESTPPARG